MSIDLEDYEKWKTEHPEIKEPCITTYCREKIRQQNLTETPSHRYDITQKKKFPLVDIPMD